MSNKPSRSTLFFNSRFTTIISIALVLFLVGGICLIGLLGKELSVFVKENIVFSVVLKDNQNQKEAKQIQKNFEKLPFIKSTTYISKEQAAKELEEELGESPEKFLGYNPLQASIEVRLKAAYADVDSLKNIEHSLRKYTQVEDLLYKQDVIRMVNQNLHRLTQILLILAIVLMLISFALINNTIQLLVNSKRFLIHTMRLVGATPGFIRKPFIWSNIFNGIWAALLAIAMLCGVLSYFRTELDGIIQLISLEEMLLIFAIMLGVGICLSALAAYIVVNRFLRMKVNRMYYN